MAAMHAVLVEASSTFTESETNVSEPGDMFDAAMKLN